jgi:hypothetical protein
MALNRSIASVFRTDSSAEVDHHSPSPLRAELETNWKPTMSSRSTSRPRCGRKSPRFAGHGDSQRPVTSGTDMVRKGSPVRVRHWALREIPAHAGVFLVSGNRQPARRDISVTYTPAKSHKEPGSGEWAALAFAPMFVAQPPQCRPTHFRTVRSPGRKHYARRSRIDGRVVSPRFAGVPRVPPTRPHAGARTGPLHARLSTRCKVLGCQERPRAGRNLPR